MSNAACRTNREPKVPGANLARHERQPIIRRLEAEKLVTCVNLREPSEAPSISAEPTSVAYSANDPRLHFGLGIEKRADVAIWWPSGVVEHFQNLAADQLVVIKEMSGVVPGGGWSRRHAD